MYRDKNRTRLTPRDTQFWQCAANLKRDGHKTIVHALAWEHPKIYGYLLKELGSKTPLERITILLWRDYREQMQDFDKRGYGSFTPTSLRNFREKYFKTGDLPNPTFIRHKKEMQANLLLNHCKQLHVMAESLSDIERRVWPTKLGQRLRKRSFSSLTRASKLQAQLS